MLRSRTPNSPLKRSSPPFSLFLQNVHPLWRPLLLFFLNQKNVAANAMIKAPPTPTQTPTTILLLVLKPDWGCGLLVVEEEGLEVDCVTIDVCVTIIVRPLSMEEKVVVNIEDEDDGDDVGDVVVTVGVDVTVI